MVFGGFWGVVPVFGGGVSYPKRVWDRLGAGFWFSGRAKADSRVGCCRRWGKRWFRAGLGVTRLSVGVFRLRVCPVFRSR